MCVYCLKKIWKQIFFLPRKKPKTWKKKKDEFIIHMFMQQAQQNIEQVEVELPSVTFWCKQLISYTCTHKKNYNTEYNAQVQLPTKSKVNQTPVSVNLVGKM